MTSKKKFSLGHHGFSMMEIMVALVLVGMIFMLIPSSSDQRDRRAIDTMAYEFDRAIRYAQDESILRNVVTRIRISLSKEPQEYVVEYGPSGNLPLPEVMDTSRMSISEREAQSEKLKSFDARFTKTDEFSEEPKMFDEIVKILGVATSYRKELIDYEDASIYFFPTGEKDSALIIMASESEMASLDIEAFQQETILDYFPYTPTELENLQYSQENKLKEIFDQWKKN